MADAVESTETPSTTAVVEIDAGVCGHRATVTSYQRPRATRSE